MIMDTYQDDIKEIDLLSLFSTLWRRRKLIIIVTGIFCVLGLIAALGTDHKYKSSIAFVPQSNSSVNSKLSSLASMAGLSLDDAGADGPISPLVYPMLLRNIDFQKELVHTPIHFKGYSEPIELVDWFDESKYPKKSFFKGLMKYTIGLPGVIVGAITPKKDEDLGLTTSDSLKVRTMTKEELAAAKILFTNLDMDVIKNERHLVLTATMNESVASAELADAAYALVKKYISSFKVSKATDNLEYLERQYANAKADYEAKQSAYAYYKDHHQGFKTAAAEVELQRLSTETDLAKMLYLELAKNCLSARVKVTEDNVAFTELVPARVPDKSANSRKTILLLWAFAGFVLSCLYVLIADAIKGGQENWNDNLIA